MTSCLWHASRDATVNFDTEGFINEDTFQVIIRESPDQNLQGLVLRRENALIKAKTSIKNTVMNTLINYCIDNFIKTSNLKINTRDELVNLHDIQKNLHEKLEKYYRRGYTSYEIFNEDQSVTICYRMTKSDLKKELESINFEYR